MPCPGAAAPEAGTRPRALIAAATPRAREQVLCATAKDEYRKPGVGAWTYLTACGNGGVAPDLAASFFVGDAAGREKDHGDSDREVRAASSPRSRAQSTLKSTLAS